MSPRPDLFKIHYNTLVASGSGSALLGASLFGAIGAVLGAAFGIFIGYSSELATHKTKGKRSRKQVN